MRIADRLGRLEAQGSARGDRQRQIGADAAEFMAMMDRLAARCAHLPRTTDAEFRAVIRQSGDPFLIDLFAKEDGHADC